MSYIADEHRRKWLAGLAKLVSPSFPVEAGASLVAMLPFLKSYPDAAFCLGSLEAVAFAKRRQSVPALDELRTALGAWWRENNPTLRLAAPPNADLPAGRVPPTLEELAAVTATLTAWREESAGHASAEKQRETGPIRDARPVPDHVLLAICERDAAAGHAGAAFRAETLRRKLGVITEPGEEYADA